MGGWNCVWFWVCAQVLAEIGSKQEGFATLRAAVGFVSGVYLLVFAQPSFVEEAFATAVADVGPGLGVLLLMLLQFCQLCKLSLAGLTYMWALGQKLGDGRWAGDDVKTLVGLHLLPGSKSSITVGTGELGEGGVGGKD